MINRPSNDIGEFKWRGVLQKVSYIEDGGGGSIPMFTDVKTLWMKKKQVFPRQDAVVSEHQQTRETVIFTAHYFEGVCNIDTENHVILYPIVSDRNITQKRYKINGIEPASNGLMFVKFRCDGEGWESA